MKGKQNRNWRNFGRIGIGRIEIEGIGILEELEYWKNWKNWNIGRIRGIGILKELEELEYWKNWNIGRIGRYQKKSMEWKWGGERKLKRRKVEKKER